MNKGTEELSRNRFWLLRHKEAAVIMVNAILLIGAFLMYSLYNDAYGDRLREENLGNIANMNQSAAVRVSSLFNSWEIKLDDTVRYAQKQRFTRNEMLAFLDESNSTRDRYFELIGTDYVGWLAEKDGNGSYPELDYRHSSYADLHDICNNREPDVAGQIDFVPEFTDGGEDAIKFLAVYKHLLLAGKNNLPMFYTLMLAVDSQGVLEVLNSQTDFDGQSTVLIDDAGNYIVSSADFKSTNFFQYLYEYNNLSLDQRRAVQQKMKGTGCGELYFTSADSEEECVFRYDRMTVGGWYCITCVPLSSFHAPAFNLRYLVYAIALILLMLGIDMVWLQSMNRRLRISVRREQEASAAKGNFMSRMSHEIRTPLNAIQGYNTIARRELASSAQNGGIGQSEVKVIDCLDKSEIASRHLLSLINDVLNMSAIESGKIQVARERFDFRGMIASIVAVFEAQAQEKNVRFQVIFDSTVDRWMVGDSLRINQVLTNLLSNALKFTDEQGTVKLLIMQKEKNSVTVKTVEAEAETVDLHIEVKDTGIGMAPEYLEHIWTPFEQADSSISRRFGGTGLGLSITKNLVDIMKGSISVSSVQGEGTTFSIDLTLGKATLEGVPEAGDSEGNSSAQGVLGGGQGTEETGVGDRQQKTKGEKINFEGARILLVEDNAMNMEIAQTLLEAEGFAVDCAWNGKEAVELFEAAEEEKYLAVLMDVHMPVMDGHEATRRIRSSAHPEADTIPIIAMTADAFAENVAEALAVGMNGHIAKPVDMQELFRMLDKFRKR